MEEMNVGVWWKRKSCNVNSERRGNEDGGKEVARGGGLGMGGGGVGGSGGRVSGEGARRVGRKRRREEEEGGGGGGEERLRENVCIFCCEGDGMERRELPAKTRYSSVLRSCVLPNNVTLWIINIPPANSQIWRALQIGIISQVTMSSATSDVTYTSVYTDSEPGRAFWGADDEEVSEGGIPRDNRHVPQDEARSCAFVRKAHDLRLRAWPISLSIYHGGCHEFPAEKHH
ncbi:hypothetical protein Tco_1245948 [Tanacetum coccineum]